MKKTIFLLTLVLISFCAKSQIIDTTFLGITACKVIPFKAKFTDSVNVTHLGVRIVNDNLKNSCTLYWSLMDDIGKMYTDGTLVIEGADYDTWGGNNLYPFTFVANKLHITFDTSQ